LAVDSSIFFFHLFLPVLKKAEKMLNFLFEGAIGELLAPVSSPFHQLQLAIQRHEHDKVTPCAFFPTRKYPGFDLEFIDDFLSMDEMALGVNQTGV
jgi:hypothetical protein